MKLNPFKRFRGGSLAEQPEVEDVTGSTVSITKYDESVLQQSRFWMRTVTWTLIGTTIFGVAWLALARTEEIVVATGKLEPIGSVKKIQMPVGGVVQQILVKDGQEVQAGQVLIKLDTETSEDQKEAFESQIKSTEQSLKLKAEELNLKKKELQSYLDMNLQEQSMLRNKLQLEIEILSRYEKLSLEGATAELQYLSQKNTVEETRGRLRQSQVDRLRQTAILNQSIQQLEQSIQQLNVQLADLKAKLTESRVTLRYQELKSPVRGLVFDMQPTSPGYTAQSTETVMKIVPYRQDGPGGEEDYGALEARVEVPSNKIGFVRTGMESDISIDSYPSTDFGVLQGEVTKVGSDALPPDPQEQRQELAFPVTITLADQQLKLKSGSNLRLGVGMSLSANIKLRKVSYLQLLLGEFQDKAESLQRL
ncbi:HlyD family secretion protein [Synechococcus sp. CC9616]|uniref:HlyD family secretion protein n=1 Tax=Synechococcus sp. CC9616 TaxID=110663 RepID=UPI00048F7AF0|nr:HlyD family efflux transporter periplasmic adaptor subunit [Synechococcus sp. CC9616]